MANCSQSIERINAPLEFLGPNHGRKQVDEQEKRDGRREKDEHPWSIDGRCNNVRNAFLPS